MTGLLWTGCWVSRTLWVLRTVPAPTCWSSTPAWTGPCMPAPASCCCCATPRPLCASSVCTDPPARRVTTATLLGWAEVRPWGWSRDLLPLGGVWSWSGLKALVSAEEGGGKGGRDSGAGAGRAGPVAPGWGGCPGEQPGGWRCQGGGALSQPLHGSLLLVHSTWCPQHPTWRLITASCTS